MMKYLLEIKNEDKEWFCLFLTIGVKYLVEIKYNDKVLT